MGIQPGTTGGVSCLPVTAYNKIWNDWFRAVPWQNECETNFAGADITYDNTETLYTALTSLKLRNLKNDYFTMGLPNPQLSQDVDFFPTNTFTVDYVSPGSSQRWLVGSDSGTFSGIDPSGTGSGSNFQSTNVNSFNASDLMIPKDGIFTVDLSYSATVNNIRLAATVQQYLEAVQRGGTRYIDQIYTLFGVRSSDARLQRSEYLGGGSQRININPIAQTSSTDVTTPQGNLAAMGTVTSKSGFFKSFEEHCIIIGLANVRADQTYQAALDRLWTRSSRLDYAFPVFAHLGEQAQYRYEIDPVNNPIATATVYGYVPRYEEYRHKVGLVTGKMRSTASGTLDSWHLALDIDPIAPTSPGELMNEQQPFDRIIAVNSEPHILLDGWMNYVCTRPIPAFSNPGLERF